jgi:signal transduction histidine kinase
MELFIRWVLLHAGNGKPEAILVFSEDAGELRQLKEDRLRSHRHECVGTLAGGIAHDLNNVLQPISMFLDLLRHRLPDAESREMLDAVEANLRRATELVRQILTFSGTYFRCHKFHPPNISKNHPPPSLGAGKHSCRSGQSDPN